MAKNGPKIPTAEVLWSLFKAKDLWIFNFNVIPPAIPSDSYLKKRPAIKDVDLYLVPFSTNVFNGCFRFQVWFTLPIFSFFPPFFPPKQIFGFLFSDDFSNVIRLVSPLTHAIPKKTSPNFTAFAPRWDPRCGSKFLHQPNLLWRVQNSVGYWLNIQEYHQIIIYPMNKNLGDIYYVYIIINN